MNRSVILLIDNHHFVLHMLCLQEMDAARRDTRYVDGRHGDVAPRETGDGALNQDDEDQVPRLLATCVMGLLILAICMFHYLPRQFAMIAISWMMLSTSVSISCGHAVLNEP